ncbi:MAG TPA: alpha/beta fold hydrolase [Pseudonocardiaceae bacterium]|jgi:pimeloyl-ACP methyl ester carboxylesterase|nr:alpha/beta fold hydrolase [Pseudonocardiaceae bacterium]
MSEAPVVLLPGFWHGSWCWSEVAAELATFGRFAVAVELAGHGLRARRPAAALARPFDPAAFATEPSPVSSITLDGAAELLVSQLKHLGGGLPCVLVAHSMGGAVASRAIELAPDLVEQVVYVAAFMPASGVPAVDYLGQPENAGDLLPTLLRADPAAIGALRLDTGSDDPDYRALLRRAFYNDVDTATAEAAVNLLNTDAPAGICAEATELTSTWGSVRRTYVHCLRDNVVRPALQRRFIAEADAAFPANPTTVAELDSSHSPMLSMPERLARIIVEV